MIKFHLRYFLTRFFLAALLTLSIVILVDTLIVNTQLEVTTFHENLAIGDPKAAEQSYWDSTYDYRKVVKHSKHYRFGKLISETRRYMDGREFTQGMGELELCIFEIAAVILIFVMVFSMVPVFLRRP